MDFYKIFDFFGYLNTFRNVDVNDFWIFQQQFDNVFSLHVGKQS